MDVQETLRDLATCLEEHWFHELELLYGRQQEHIRLQIALVLRLNDFALNFGLPGAGISVSRGGHFSIKTTVDDVTFNTPIDNALGCLTMRVYDFHHRPTVAALNTSGVIPLAEMFNNHLPDLLTAAFAAADTMEERRRVAARGMWAMAMWYGVPDLEFCIGGISGNGQTTALEEAPWQMFYAFSHFDLQGFRRVGGVAGNNGNDGGERSDGEEDGDGWDGEWDDEGEVEAMNGHWGRLFRRVRW